MIASGLNLTGARLVEIWKLIGAKNKLQESRLWITNAERKRLGKLASYLEDLAKARGWSAIIWATFQRRSSCSGETKIFCSRFKFSPSLEEPDGQNFFFSTIAKTKHKSALTASATNRDSAILRVISNASHHSQNMYILREHYKKKLHQETTSEEQTYAARNNIQIKAWNLETSAKKLE